VYKFEGEIMDKTLERILSLIPKKPDGKFQHGAIKEFANSIGLKSGNLIPDWINGRSSSYKNYLYQIADQYHVSVAWLKGETDEKIPAPTNGDGEIADFISELTEELADMTPAETALVIERFKDTIKSVKGTRQ
jgi:hypothetical protein